MSTKLYVIPVRGGWGILAQGRREPMLQHSTKSRAIAVARETISRQGGGQVLVLNRSGEVIDSRAVPSQEAPIRARSQRRLASPGPG